MIDRVFRGVWETPARWGVYPLRVNMPVSASVCASERKGQRHRPPPHSHSLARHDAPDASLPLPTLPARVMQTPASATPESRDFVKALSSLPKLRELPLEEVHALADEVAQCERFSREQHSFFNANDTKLKLAARVLRHLDSLLSKHGLPRSGTLVDFVNLAQMADAKFYAIRNKDMSMAAQRLKSVTGIDLNSEPWTCRLQSGRPLRLVFTDFDPSQVYGDLKEIVDHLGLWQSGIAVREEDIRQHAKRVVATTRRFLMMVDAYMRSLAETALRESAELVAQLLTERELAD